MTHKIKWIYVFLCLSEVLYTNEIEKKWEIFFGQGPNNIQTVDDLVLYDFEIWNGYLFLCDIVGQKIRIFDKNGRNVESISLKSVPEIITIRDNFLVILMHTNELGIYELKEKKLTVVDLEIDVNPYSYSGSFFADSLLFIPKSDEFISVKNDAYIVDISRLPRVELKTVKDAYDIEKQMNWPDDSISIGNSYYIQQIDFCYCSGRYLIVEKSDKHHPERSNNNYLLIDNRFNRVINLGKIPKEDFGTVLHTYICRGFKVYNDGIYFSSLTYKNYKEKSLIIGKIKLPH